MDDYVAEPVNPDALAHVVRRFLATREDAKTVPASARKWSDRRLSRLPFVTAIDDADMSPINEPISSRLSVLALAAAP